MSRAFAYVVGVTPLRLTQRVTTREFLLCLHAAAQETYRGVADERRWQRPVLRLRSAVTDQEQQEQRWEVTPAFTAYVMEMQGLSSYVMGRRHGVASE